MTQSTMKNIFVFLLWQLLLLTITGIDYPFKDDIDYDSTDPIRSFSKGFNESQKRVSRSNPVYNMDLNTVPRLPTNVIPVSYKIKLTVRMQDHFTFDGNALITIDVKVPTNTITLHSNELMIMRIILILHGDEFGSRPSSYTIDYSRDFLNVTFETSIPSGRHQLHIKYMGYINKEPIGFYRTKYTENNETLWLTATQFEPTSARMVFPCWDEPELKATFSVAIVHSEKYKVISNMDTIEVKNLENDTDQIQTHFAETPKMSTYLLAFVISEFDCLQNHNGTVELWARRDVIDKIQYVQELSEKILKAMENFTGFSYNVTGFSKLKMVILPHYMGGIAGMENWGLITLSERIIVGATYSSNTYSMIQAEQVIVHEIAHQWFGNLVSSKWWNCLWLKEGFATFLQTFIRDQIEKTSYFTNDFVVSNLQGKAFRIDQGIDAIDMSMIKRSSRPPKEAAVIIYQKSSCIIRMFFHIVGPKDFRTIVQNYLRNNAFAAADPEDLMVEFEILSGTASDILKEAMDNWITTPGFPLITVTRNYTTQTANITQSRFLIGSHNESAEKYWVPINFATEDDMDFENTNVTYWLSPTNSSIEIAGMPENKWLILNKQQFGYYRVNYDEDNWRLIIKALKSKNFNNIHVLNRAQLLDDAFNLAMNNQLRWSVVLSLIGYLEEETDFTPWVPALNVIKLLKSQLSQTKYDNLFQNYISIITEKVARRFLIDGAHNDDFANKFYTDSTRTVCLFDSPSCVEATSVEFDKWMSSLRNDSVESPNSLWTSISACAGVRHANESTWGELFEKWQNGQNHLILEALACTPNTTILNTWFRAIIDFHFDSLVNFTEIVIAKNSDKGVSIALKAIAENWVTIVKQHKEEYLIIMSVYYEISHHLRTPENLKMMKDFTNKHKNTIQLYIPRLDLLTIPQNSQRSDDILLTECQKFFTSNTFSKLIL